LCAQHGRTPAGASPAAGWVKASLIVAQPRQGDRAWNVSAEPQSEPFDENRFKCDAKQVGWAFSHQALFKISQLKQLLLNYKAFNSCFGGFHFAV